MTPHIVPFQSGGDLVFCLIQDDQIARYPTRYAQRPGYTESITGQIATYPTVALAKRACASFGPFEWWPI